MTTTQSKRLSPKMFNILTKMMLLFFVMIVIFMPAFTPEAHLRGGLFFKVRATNLHCRLEYEQYTLIDTRNYVEAPALTSFGYGIDAGTIFTVGNNTITLIVEPVETPQKPLITDRYCEIGLSLYVEDTFNDAYYDLPFNVAFDDNGQPYSLDKGEMDSPNIETDPRNEISINYHGDNPEIIESITLQKHVNIQF